MSPHFRLATARDDEALRELFREIGMEGDISISFEREPNFFRAMQPQGDVQQVIVCEDLDTGEIMGLGSRATSNTYLKRQNRKIAYLSDLRVKGKYRKGTGLVRGYRFLHELQETDPVSATYTVIFESNREALSTIAKGRAGLPTYRDQGRWECPALWLGGEWKATIPGIEIAPAKFADLSEIVNFLNKTNQDRPLAPVHQVVDFGLGGRWEGFDLDNLLVARQKNEIVGVLGAWDQHDFKQSRILGYKGKMKWASRFSRLAPRRLGFPALPKEGQYLHYLSTCFHAARDPDISRCLLTQIHNLFRKQNYQYLLVGLHEDDPFAEVVHSFPQTPFYGRLFTVDYDKPVDLGNGIPYLENVAL